MSTDLADGGRSGGWNCLVGGGCLGRDSGTFGGTVGEPPEAAAAAGVEAWQAFFPGVGSRPAAISTKIPAPGPVPILSMAGPAVPSA